MIWLAFFIGYICGVVAGVAIMGLCSAAADADRRMGLK